MKITTLLLVLGFSQAFATVSYSQNAKITVRVENTSLEKVIKLIEEQSEFLFFYNLEDVDKGATVTMDKSDSNIQDVLDEISKTAGFLYRIKDRHIILTTRENKEVQSPQQNRVQVSGIVKDEYGEPIIGANILEQGTSNGTITDLDGRFNLSVSPDASINITCIGYKTQIIKVGNQRSFNIILVEDAEVLDEVVVVGYGTVRKANLTGAVDQVKGRVLEDRPILSVAQALQGTIANLNITSSTNNSTAGGGSPGARMSMNIRGVTGLSNENTASSGGPLFVIDGIQSQDINAINPDDIESISVLKDAASAAIYGSNAPYGVVLVTTKKGAKGAKPTISYSTNIGWSSAIGLPTQMNSVEWAELMNSAKNNTVPGTNFLKDENMQRIRDYYEGKITTPTVANPNRTLGQTWASFDDFGNGLGNDNINWYNVHFKDAAFSQQHNVSMQGGTQNTAYYVGLGYNHKDGLLKYGNDNFDRFTLRANLSSEITPWFAANVRTSYTKGIHDTPSNTGSDNFMQIIAQRWPIIPLKNNDGRYSENSLIDNYLQGGRKTTTDNLLVLTGEFVIKPMKGWDATLNYTYTTNNIAQEKNSLHYTMYDANNVPYYRPGWPGDEYNRGRDNLFRQRIDDEKHTVNAFTSYEFSKKGHYFKGMIGFAQEYNHYYRMDASSGSVTLYTTGIPTFDTSYYDTNEHSITEPQKKTVSTRGVFGRINYSYEDRYLVEFNGRYDGSSRYMKDNRFKFYPGVSGAWVVSQEKFWGDSMANYVDFFKLRASYGSLGESGGTNFYPFYPGLATQSASSSNWLFNGNRYSGLSFPRIINPNITWVTSTTIDIGFDITALNNRFSATFDWFTRSSDDVVGPAEQLPAVLGANAPDTNNAAIRTNGYELTMSWRDQIRSIGLSYGIRATLADATTKVKKYPNANKTLGRWYEGATIGDIWGYVTDGYYTIAEEEAGIDQNVQGNNKGPGLDWTAGDTKYKDLDGDGIITYGDNTVDNPGDKKVIGNSTPRYTYGITLDASWKGFDISMFFQGVGKRDAWISTGGPGNFWGTQDSEWQANFLTIHRDRWTPETPNGYFPKYYLQKAKNQKNQQVQTKYLQDASYLRFKNLQIGYTLPKKLLDKVGITKLRVYVSGENLATFTNFVETIDPEFAGVDLGLAYPLQRTWSFGLNLSF